MRIYRFHFGNTPHEAPLEKWAETPFGMQLQSGSFGITEISVEWSSVLICIILKVWQLTIICQTNGEIVTLSQEALLKFKNSCHGANRITELS